MLCLGLKKGCTRGTLENIQMKIFKKRFHCSSSVVQDDFSVLISGFLISNFQIHKSNNA